MDKKGPSLSLCSGFFMGPENVLDARLGMDCLPKVTFHSLLFLDSNTFFNVFFLRTSPLALWLFVLIPTFVILYDQDFTNESKRLNNMGMIMISTILTNNLHIKSKNQNKLTCNIIVEYTKPKNLNYLY